MTDLEKLMEALGVPLGERTENVRIGECPRCHAEMHVHIPRQFIHCFGCGIDLAELRRMRLRLVVSR